MSLVPPGRRACTLTVAATVLALAGTAFLDSPAPAVTAGNPKGHDVSSHQGKVDWRRARARGASFVYVKATEGTRYENPHFSQQYDGSHAAGLLRGAYHFARADASSGRAQAAYFVRNGGQWRRDGATLPPAVDLESLGGKPCHGLSPARMRGWIRAFSAEVLRRTDRHPTLYTSARWWNRCTGGSREFAANHPLWLADWGREAGPLPEGWSERTIWQYANKGRLPGDQNLFNGSMVQLRSYARG